MSDKQSTSPPLATSGGPSQKGHQSSPARGGRSSGGEMRGNQGGNYPDPSQPFMRTSSGPNPNSYQGQRHYPESTKPLPSNMARNNVSTSGPSPQQFGHSPQQPSNALRSGQHQGQSTSQQLSQQSHQHNKTAEGGQHANPLFYNPKNSPFMNNRGSPPTSSPPTGPQIQQMTRQHIRGQPAFPRQGGPQSMGKQGMYPAQQAQQQMRSSPPMEYGNAQGGHRFHPSMTTNLAQNQQARMAYMNHRQQQQFIQQQPQQRIYRGHPPQQPNGKSMIHPQQLPPNLASTIRPQQVPYPGLGGQLMMPTNPGPFPGGYGRGGGIALSGNTGGLVTLPNQTKRYQQPAPKSTSSLSASSQKFIPQKKKILAIFDPDDESGTDLMAEAREAEEKKRQEIEAQLKAEEEARKAAAAALKAEEAAKAAAIQAARQESPTILRSGMPAINVAAEPVQRQALDILTPPVSPEKPNPAEKETPTSEEPKMLPKKAPAQSILPSSQDLPTDQQLPSRPDEPKRTGSDDELNKDTGKVPVRRLIRRVDAIPVKGRDADGLYRYNRSELESLRNVSGFPAAMDLIKTHKLSIHDPQSRSSRSRDSGGPPGLGNRGMTARDQRLAGNHNRGRNGGGNNNYGRNNRNNRRYNNNNYNEYSGPVKALEVSENAWKQGIIEADALVAAQKKMQGMLNKLTLEKFDSIARMIEEYVITICTKPQQHGEETVQFRPIPVLYTLVKLIFEKVLGETNYASMYSRLCKTLVDKFVLALGDARDEKGELTGAIFLNEEEQKDPNFACTEDKLTGHKVTDMKRLLLSEVETAFQDGSTILPREQFESDEAYTRQKAKKKKKYLGNITFVGELCHSQLLPQNVVVGCLDQLIGQYREESFNGEMDEATIECACRLLTTVGMRLEKQKYKKKLDLNMQAIENLSTNKKLASRTRFMCLDLIELRSLNWVPRIKKLVAKTIDEIHKDFDAETSQPNNRGRDGRRREQGFGDRNNNRGDVRRAPVKKFDRYASFQKGGDNNDSRSPPGRIATRKAPTKTSNKSKQIKDVEFVAATPTNEKERRAECVALFGDFLSEKNEFKKVVTTVDRINDGDKFGTEIVSEAIVYFLKAKNKEQRNATQTLLVEVLTNQKIPQKSFASGLENFLKNPKHDADYYEDFSAMLFGQLFGFWIVNSCIDAQDFMKLILSDEQLEDMGQTELIFKGLIKQIVTLSDESQAKAVMDLAPLKTPYVNCAKPSMTKEMFAHKHKLEFILDA